RGPARRRRLQRGVREPAGRGGRLGLGRGAGHRRPGSGGQGRARRPEPTPAATHLSAAHLTDRRVAVLSFRLGGRDGVSVEADKWTRVLRDLGFGVTTVAGDGPVDRTVPGLDIDATDAPDAGDVEAALADADLVVVENLCSLPLNLPAA